MQPAPPPVTPVALPPNTAAKWWRDRSLIAILATATIIGLAYNAVMIVGLGPDETRHMAYIKLLLDEHRLPFLLPNGHEYAGAHTFHPPLYYALELPLYAAFRWLPGQGAWHVVRFGSLLFCLAALPLIYQIGLRAGRGCPACAALVTAMVGLLPMWGMTAGTINNDSATLFFVTLFLWLLTVRHADDRTLKSALTLGVCMGLGTLCKGTVLLCDTVALVAYLLAQDGWRALLNRRAWERLGIVVLCVVVLAGWWHWRSFMLYHTFTPLPPSMPTPLLPSPKNGPLVMMMHDNFPLLFAYANWSMLCTMWSQKDWIPEAVRDPIYWLLAGYCGMGLVGLVVARLKKRKRPPESLVPLNGAGGPAVLAMRSSRLGQCCIYTAFAANWLAVLQVAMFWHWGWAEGGRYLLPSLCGFSALIAAGWRSLVGPLRLAWVVGMWSMGLVGLNLLCIYWLLAYLNPKFG